MSLIDPDAHAELIERQRASNRAWAALDSYAAGARHADLTEEQRAVAAQLREEACTAALALREALHSSGLIREHGYHRPARDLREAVRAQEPSEF